MWPFWNTGGADTGRGVEKQWHPGRTYVELCADGGWLLVHAGYDLG